MYIDSDIFECFSHSNGIIKDHRKSHGNRSSMQYLFVVKLEIEKQTSKSKKIKHMQIIRWPFLLSSRLERGYFYQRH